MDSALPPASVEPDRIRELLASDRRLVGQARAFQQHAPLRTAAFHQPLLVRVRRRVRRDRSLRVRLICGGLLLMLSAALGLWLRGRSLAAQPPALDASPSGQTLESEPNFAPPSSIRQDPPPDAVEDAVIENEPRPVSGSALSATRRLQRADLWLRMASPQAAREARRLIESALDELPGSVHGQVSLAEACLRLGDERCARTAIHTAILARPWRAKYRALAERIDAAFTGGDLGSSAARPASSGGA